MAQEPNNYDYMFNVYDGLVRLDKEYNVETIDKEWFSPILRHNIENLTKVLNDLTEELKENDNKLIVVDTQWDLCDEQRNVDDPTKLSNLRDLSIKSNECKEYGLLLRNRIKNIKLLISYRKSHGLG